MSSRFQQTSNLIIKRCCFAKSIRELFRLSVLLFSAVLSAVAFLVSNSFLYTKVYSETVTLQRELTRLLSLPGHKYNLESPQK